MSKPIQTVPIPNGSLHTEPSSGAHDSNPDTQELQRRNVDLIQERDQLKQELAKAQQERDGYLKTVYHFMCKDYVCPYTSEELLSFVDCEQPLRDLISQLERESEIEA